MEKENKFLTGEAHFIKLIEKNTSSLLFETEDGQGVVCNESDVESIDNYELGEEYSMFIYPSRSGKLFASPYLPEVMVGTYGFAKVVKVTDEGAGLDIGISREILLVAEDLPKLRSVWPVEGDELFVTLRRDYSGQLFARLATETIVESMYSKGEKSLFNTEIVAYPYRLMKVGTFLLSKEGYKIFVHESERKKEPRLGQEVSVRIIGIKDDGSMNASFLPRAHERIDDDSQAILDYIENNNGYCEYSDKSKPEDIKAVFGMSKGSFKKAAGRLFKNKKITIEEDGLYKRKGR
ncbi:MULTISPECIES: S1 RNA-binding domain-containing protein [unclassified Gemella]|uniref:CvfB family protein n=1 Tax=unclassified Gemella TaxID=2624949 RepID=UPI0010745517|nr:MULTISPECIES: RNA-binding protein [unclassified Gemella]MBF0709845.1 RNA-binding protein [Gemella sp. GL1.1]MBF0746850.1 RNA-binding protein [Gemella sp. 19428wG2_WT2a]NYS27189.1 RNA-binding protein [Gemella sp. GL1]TFU59574.1 RNA-binding protein [Gemella sp. WT2a]